MSGPLRRVLFGENTKIYLNPRGVYEFRDMTIAEGTILCIIDNCKVEYMYRSNSAEWSNIRAHRVDMTILFNDVVEIKHGYINASGHTIHLYGEKPPGELSNLD